MLFQQKKYLQTNWPSSLNSKPENKAKKHIIKNFLKTSFSDHKKWAVWENLEDFIEVLNDLGDQDISDHLRKSSSRETYVSTTSTD